MKTSLFIGNVISALLIVNFVFTNPSITGFAVASQKLELNITSPLGMAIIFIVTIIALDVYFYRKSKR
jgi:hypothetical protein